MLGAISGGYFSSSVFVFPLLSLYLSIWLQLREATGVFLTLYLCSEFTRFSKARWQKGPVKLWHLTAKITPTFDVGQDATVLSGLWFVWSSCKRFKSKPRAAEQWINCVPKMNVSVWGAGATSHAASQGTKRRTLNDTGSSPQSISASFQTS